MMTASSGGLDQRQHVIRPTRQGVSLLFSIACAIINACNSALMAAYVIHDSFYDVGLDANLSHSCDSGSSKIV
jgi:hypothetical protein